VLFDQAIKWFVERDMVSVITDDFGPPMYQPTPDFSDKWEALRNESNPLFYRHSLAPNGERWLIQALDGVNKAFDELKIASEDFISAPDVDEWEPLPVDRSDPQLEKAIKNLDEVIEQVRSDNGYSAKLPEERSYILDKLTAVSRKLKTEATISWTYLNEFALKPLGQLVKRFGGAAAGLAAVVARDSLIGWMKTFGARAIDFLTKHNPFF
jgi:hypothetical protein